MIKKLASKKVYLIPAVVSLIGIVGIVYFYFFTGFSSASNTHYIYIDGDDSVDSVCAKLAPAATQHGMTALRTLLRYGSYEDHIRTGRYAIKPDAGVVGVFRMLRNGQQTPMMLTIPESRTMDRLASVLSRRLMLDSATIATALTTPESVAAYGYDTCTIACMFVPNTYEVYWNIGIDQLLERMKKEHDVFWNYDRLHKAEAIGLTPNEVCTLASIIDEETANTAEKPMIAGMYLNRLAKDMPLQADPTVKFALRNFELKRIYHNMLTTESPYNTYSNTGLPPGPIKIASIKGVDAVLNRVAHDYLYMCAKEDFSGTHNFARTYKEHLQNAARYSKALNDRDIR
jgi:UPF0755 protein